MAEGQDVGFLRSYFPRGEKNQYKIGVMAFAIALSIGLLAALNEYIGTPDYPFIVTSFGATAVLIYAAPKSPLAQPKNVFFGHVISATVGTTVAFIFGSSWWAITLGVTVAIIIMDQTGTLHPPGGATALWCVQTDANFTAIFVPVMLGAVIMLVIRLLSEYLRRRIDQKKPEVLAGEKREGKVRTDLYDAAGKVIGSNEVPSDRKEKPADKKDASEDKGAPVAENEAPSEKKRPSPMYLYIHCRCTAMSIGVGIIPIHPM